ncbi:MAG: hypothetical protein VKP57_01295, partial [Candidatus Sericytochromatia bacterium]|nr:hypothetical protein [Candidatus Sericytochromatia bacterium]
MTGATNHPRARQEGQGRSSGKTIAAHPGPMHDVDVPLLSGRLHHATGQTRPDFAGVARAFRMPRR